MKLTKLLLKSINNTRDGYHLASKYWQDYKNGLPLLPQHLVEVLVGMVLGDASMSKVSKEAYVKFEQGHAQERLIKHLFELFKQYCFMLQPGTRIEKNGPRIGLVKSLWFKTFSHKSFTEVWKIFYITGKKTIRPGLVAQYVTRLSLAYWIMCDGSLNGNTMILHTQSYSHSENIILSQELNQKFGLHSQVIQHKGKYWVIKIPSEDAKILRDLIAPYIIPSMEYKLPK